MICSSGHPLEQVGPYHTLGYIRLKKKIKKFSSFRKYQNVPLFEKWLVEDNAPIVRCFVLCYKY